MGQHKTNPNCQLAKEGKLPPKPKRMGKRERDRELYKMVCQTTRAAILEAFIKKKY